MRRDLINSNGWDETAKSTKSTVKSGFMNALTAAETDQIPRAVVHGGCQSVPRENLVRIAALPFYAAPANEVCEVYTFYVDRKKRVAVQQKVGETGS